MQMDVGLDTGDMMHKIACPIESSDTSASLYDKLAQLGPQGMLTAAPNGKRQRHPRVQDEALVTYAEAEQRRSSPDWTLSAAQLERCIRAFNPWPVSYFTIDDQPVKVWQASVLAQSANAEPAPLSMPTSTAFRWRPPTASSI